MKRFASIVAAVAAFGLGLSACGGGATTGPSAPGGASPGDKTYEIGAVTIVSHPALDAISAGFQEGLREAGIAFNYDFQNPQGDQATLASIANTFASSKKDLYLAIATPPVQALAQSIKDAPIVFAAVTDPKVAGVVDSWERPGGNVTGMSDLSPVKEQLALVKEIKPDAKTVGIVYSSSEANSQVLVDLATKEAPALGLEIKTATVVNTSEVGQAAESLAVDAYYVLTDNTVVTAVESIVQVAETNKRLVIAADTGSADRGAAAALSLDYHKQGKQAAAMAVKILRDGAKPADLPVETQKELDLVVNAKAAAAQGVTLPESVTKRAVKTIQG
ncbi:MAG: ABC transporter substrate-binding protein [Propionibacteriaceae bacterium]|nr:ABC transporter substrate-binding protein [Propionibacteriaceae bacterium]